MSKPPEKTPNNKGQSKRHDSQYLLNEVIDNIPAFISYIDKQERYQFVNEYGLNFLDHPRDDIVGLQLKDVHSDNYDVVRKLARKALSGEETILDLKMIAANGGEIYLYGLTRPDMDEAGNVHGFYMIAQNVTDLKKAQRKSAKAKKDAEKASKAKSEFLANMSHEIRTPLNGIIGLANLLRKTDLDEKQAKYVSMISDSGNLLLKIISDVLDLAKIENQKIHLDLQDFDIQNRLNKIYEKFHEQAEAKGLKMTFESEGDVPEKVLGDPDRIEQIVNNLIGNALKYTPDGEIHIKTSATPSKDNICRILIEVSDTGMGIPQDTQKDLFEKFTQVRDRKKEDIEGTGLGLAIAKSLVEEMDGDIGFESTEGEGSRFWFEIPLKVTEIQEAEPAITQDNNAQLEEDHEFGGHVLVVEDIDTNRLIFKDLLESLGLSVDEAVNGQEAVEKASKNEYDLILMDIRMPVMDGIEATEKILEFQREHRIYTPVVALTAYALGSQIQECLSAGMSDFLTKPLQEEDLVMVLHEWLGGHDPVASVALQEVQQKRWEKIRSSGSSVSDAPEKSIDTSFLDMLYENNPDKAKEIIRSTLKDLDENISPVEAHIAGQDFDEIHKCAHSVKSLAAQCGALKLSALAKELEEMLTDDEAPDEGEIRKIYDKMTGSFSRFQDVMHTYE